MPLRLHPAQGDPIEVGAERSLVGRDRTAEVRINESSISRKHATIEHRGAEWVIIDNGSANGTFLDDVQVAEAVLRNGQSLRLGAASFRVEIEIPPSPTQTLRPQDRPPNPADPKTQPGIPRYQPGAPAPAVSAPDEPTAPVVPAVVSMTAAQAAEVLGVERRRFARGRAEAVPAAAQRPPDPDDEHAVAQPQADVPEEPAGAEAGLRAAGPGSVQRMSATVFAPASIGNVGPGFDVLGLAVEGVGDEVRLERTDGPSTIEEITGVDAELLPRAAEKNVVTVAAEAMLRALGEGGGVRVWLHKGIPQSGGLGGSAASSVAGAHAAAVASGHDPSPLEVMAAALTAEATVAGRHLDNIAACVLGGLTLCRSTDPIDVVRVPIARPLWVALVTPAVRLETRTARSVLSPTSDRADWVQQMANTAALLHGLSSGRPRARVAVAGGRLRRAQARAADPALRRGEARGAGGGSAGLLDQRSRAHDLRPGRGRGEGDDDPGGDAGRAGRHARARAAHDGGHGRGTDAMTTPAVQEPAGAREWLACLACRATYGVDEVRYACACGGLLSVDRPAGWAARLRPASVRRAPLLARRRRSQRRLALPRSRARPAGGLAGHPSRGRHASVRAAVPLGWAGVERLFFKHEGENPTGSFKDRGMAVGITQAVRVGARAVACASTGNTSSSLAAYAAQVGLPAFVFLPAGKVAMGKLAQTLAYGARVPGRARRLRRRPAPGDASPPSASASTS